MRFKGSFQYFRGKDVVYDDAGRENSRRKISVAGGHKGINDNNTQRIEY